MKVGDFSSINQLFLLNSEFKTSASRCCAEALRNSSSLPNARLQVLHELTLDIVRSRGVPNKEKIDAFFEQGFKEAQLLEIILGLSQKVMSNYINHLSETPVDKAFAQFTWSKNY